MVTTNRRNGVLLVYGAYTDLPKIENKETINRLVDSNINSFMHTKESMLFIALGSLLFSCKNARHEESFGIDESYTCPDTSLTTIKIEELNNSTLCYSSIYKNIDYITLEQTDYSLLGNIDILLITQEGDFIVFDRNNGSICRFSNKGKFLNRIGNHGHSKSEYIRPTHISLDKNNNNIIVFDNAKQSIITYTVDGDFIDSNRICCPLSSFKVIDNDTLVVFSNYIFDPKAEGTNYNIKIITKGGQILSQYAQFPQLSNNKGTIASYVFTSDSDKIYYKSYYSPYIFRIDNSEMKPQFYLDFGESSIPNEWFYLPDEEFEQNMAQNRDIAFCSKSYIGNDCIALNIIKNRFEYLYLICQQDTIHEVQYGNIFLNDIFGLLTGIDIKYRDEKKLYFSIDNEQISQIQCITQRMEIGQDVVPQIINSYKNNDLYKTSSSYRSFCDVHVQKLKEAKYILSKDDLDFIKKTKNNTNPIIQICELK